MSYVIGWANNPPETDEEYYDMMADIAMEAREAREDAE